MSHQNQLDLVDRLEKKAAQIQLEALRTTSISTCILPTNPTADLLQEAATEIRRQREGISLMANEINTLWFRLTDIL